MGKTLIAITNLPPRPMMGIDSCGMIISAIHHEEGEERLNLLMVDDRIPAGAKLYFKTRRTHFLWPWEFREFLPAGAGKCAEPEKLQIIQRKRAAPQKKGLPIFLDGRWR